MNFFYANGTPIINSLKVTSEVPLDPRLTVENIAERDSLVTNHISYDRMKVYVKSNDTKYIYHKDTGEWEIDNKFSEEDKSKLDRIDNYLIDTEHIYNPENKLLYREHSYDPNTDITTLRDHILQEARVSENGELYNGLLSKFYVNRLNNITGYLTNISFTKSSDTSNLYLTTHTYNPDNKLITRANINIPVATDDNNGLLSNVEHIKLGRIIDYMIEFGSYNNDTQGLKYIYKKYNPNSNATTNHNVIIPLVTHTLNGLLSSTDKIKIDDIETYIKSIALRQASGTEELGIDYVNTNPNTQTDTPGFFNLPLVTDTRNGLVSPARKHWMDNANGVSNTGTASDTWQLDKKDINTRLDPNGGVIIKDSGGIAEIRNSTDSAYSDLTLNNITIKGDVTQEGRSFITEAETVEVRDNTLLLNRGETGAGVSKEFAGIEIDRGSEPKYQILFDESDDRFKAGVEGDLWNLALRESDDNMLDGYFISWNSKDKILSTTNIVNKSTPLLFNTKNISIGSEQHQYEQGVYTQDSLCIKNYTKTLWISGGENYFHFDTTGSHFEFWKPILGKTFIRSTDKSEVLYHADIVNNLTSGGTNKVLSAEQGKLLQNSITSIQGSYLPLSGGTMTGSIIFPNRKGIFGTLTNGTSNIKIAVVDANNNVEIGNSNTPLMLVSNSTDLTHYRDNNTYEIWDKYNLTNPVTYTTNTYNHATLTNKDGQYFTYIKAGTNGLLPHSKATLVSGGSGSLGTSDQSFNAAYINNLHTNKITFGETGPYITGSTSATQFLNAEGGTQKVATGSLYVGTSYASDALSLVPANGIYSRGIIYIENGIGFRNSIWTNDLTPNRNYSGYLQVLDAYDANNAGGPTNYGTVLQVNSRNAHWANQLWFPGGAEASKKGLYYRHMPYNSTTYGEWIKLATTSDLGNYLPLSGGTLSGNLTINTVGSTTFVINNNDTNGSETFMRVLRKGTASAAIGFKDSLGAYIYNYNSNKYLFIANDGYARVGTTSGSTRLALITDIPTVSGYLPLTGGTLTGTLSINSGGSEPLIINNSASAGEAYVVTKTQGTTRGVMGWNSSLGMFLQDNRGYTFSVKADGVYFGASSSTLTKLPTSTDLSGYLPLAGGTMSGNISFNGGTGHIVVGARETSNYVSAVSFNKGSATNSAYIGYHSTGGSDSSGALILVPYSTSANPWGKTVGLYIAKNELLLDGKAIATQEYVNNRSVSWSNITGKPSTYTPSAHSHNSLQIEDNRGVTMLPNNMGPTTLRTFFNANNMPTSDWYSGIHISGWVTNYAAWELCGPSSNNTTTASSLYFRSGKDSTWNSWKKIAFTSDIPTIPSISISNSGSGNAVTSITASGHTLTVTKGATYLTSSALSGYATQSWANGQFAPLKNYFVTSNCASIATTGNEMCIGSLTSGNSIINVNYRNGTGTTSPSTWYWRAGSSTSWANAYWGNLYMNNNLVATQTWSNSQYPLKTGTGASGTWDINISGNASTASAASKLGSTTIGGSAKPIYLSSGTPTACSATVGSATVPVYMNAGTITQCSTTLGVSITGNAATAATATKWNGYSIWTGTEDELPSSRDANTLYFVKKSQ